MRLTIKTLSLLLLALALLLGSGCAGTFRATHRVAVVDFENLTGDPNYRYLQGALGEYLTTYLANSGAIMMRDRQDIQRKLIEIDSTESEAARLARWRILGRRIDVQYLVGGSVSRLEGNFVLNARLFNVSLGEVVPGSAFTETCKYEYEIYDRMQRVGAYLANQLKMRGVLTEPAPAGASPGVGQ